MYTSNIVRLVAWGPYGLFTRPEFRADRVTYRICPPTAGAGIGKAIFWHPECDVSKTGRAVLDMEMVRICLLAPIVTMTMRCNEIDQVPSVRSLPVSLEGPRQTSLLLLKDLKYLIEYRYIALDSQATARKGEEMFRRRLALGQHFRQPCFGRRRYPAYVREATSEDKPIAHDEEFGPLSWGIEYRGEQQILHTHWGSMRGGVMDVPSFLMRGETTP